MTERGAQVQLMPQIYSNAKIVLAWLGHNPMEADYCLKEDAPEFLNDLLPLMQLMNDDEGAKELLEAGATVNDICGRTYWRRIWIFQEILLARSVWLQYGLHKVSFNVFNTWCKPVVGPSSSIRRKTTASQIPTGFTGNVSEALYDFDLRVSGSAIISLTNDWFLANIKTQDYLSDRPTMPESLMLTCGDQECTDPRDRIVALLSLFDTSDKEVDLDYESLYRRDLGELYRYIAAQFEFRQCRRDDSIWAGTGTLERHLECYEKYYYENYYYDSGD